MAYADASDMRNLGLPDGALEELTDSQILDFLEVSTGIIDSYLEGQYTLPIQDSKGFLKRCNIDLAAHDVLLWRGYNAEDHDDMYVMRVKVWNDRLEMIRCGTLGVPGARDLQVIKDRPTRVSSNIKRSTESSSSSGCCEW